MQQMIVSMGFMNALRYMQTFFKEQENIELLVKSGFDPKDISLLKSTVGQMYEESNEHVDDMFNIFKSLSGVNVQKNA